MSNDITRPIIGIENRTAQEVFDIMCDRARSLAQEREELRHDIDRHIKITAEQATENEELRKALRKIAGKTYGTEINDSDADRADIYWQHITRFQSIARAALKDT